MPEPPNIDNRYQTRERRSSVRRPIKLAATLNYGTQKGMSCEISDFCPEGVYVTYSQGVDNQLRKSFFSSQAMVNLIFHDPFVNRDHQLHVKVVRTLEGSFGGMFTEDNAAAVTALLRICGAENIRSNTPVAQPETASLLMRQCERTISTYGEPLFGQFMRMLPGRFDEAINGATTDNQKTALMDAVVALRKQSGNMLPLFFQNIGEALVPRFSKVGSGEEGEEKDKLSLIDKAEFEDWLTLKVMVTKAESTYQENLLKIKMRFDALGILSVKGYPNPVGPPLLCNAFKDMLITLGLPVAAERICLKQFEESVLNDLSEMYTEIDSLLARQGALPDLDLGKYIKTPEPLDATPELDEAEEQLPEEEHLEDTPLPQTEKREAPFSEGNAKQEPVFTEEEPADQPPRRPWKLNVDHAPIAEVGNYLASAEESVAVVNSLLETLKQRRQSSGAEQGDSVFPSEAEAPAFQNAEVISSLHHAQTAPMENGSIVDKTSLRQRLSHMVEQNQLDAKALSASQDKNLDVVDRFFSSLLKNRKLTDVAKMQIKGLEVPVLQLMMRNPAFLEDSNNSARQLIDRLASVGVKGGRISGAQQERINSLIMRIQAEHDQDGAVFDEALDEVDDIVERQNLLYRRNVERVTAAAEGQQKVEESKRAVSESIAECVSGKRVPKAVSTLLNGGWKDLLSLTYIRQGPESQNWQDYLNALKTLIAVGQDSSFQYNLPELLKVIQEGLGAISANHIPSGHIRDEIKRLLVRKPGDAEPELVEIPSATESPSSPSENQVEEAKNRGLQRWLQRVQKLKTGDWLRLERENKEFDYIRLVWVGKKSSRYVFVNHQGMKVIDLDALTLAAYMQKGIAVPEPHVERPVVDESLDTMVKDLYDQLSFSSTHDELTGLMLRKEFERQVLVQQSQLEEVDNLTCMLVSLEQFRLVNDSGGTEAGDQVLKDLAFNLKSCLPDSALICRYSGDEFMITIVDRANHWLQVVGDTVSSYRLHREEAEHKVTAGIGYVEVRQGMLDVQHLLQAAEDSCRKAKKKGTGNIEAFNFNQQQIDQRDAIAHKVASLGRELDDERLLLRSQKIIPLKQDTHLGMHHEILLSIYDEQGHLIPVGDFIRAAEGYKRMQEVDRWVVGRMLDWLVDNRHKISQIGGISINLSGHSLNDESLLEFIFERLTKYDCPLEKVTFEITEAAAIANLYDVSDFISELQEYGCRFCLGHYGTGMVSYQFLKELPVDMIKLDGSFIRELTKDHNDQMMVKSMAEMAHYLKREVVAPLVETKEELEILKQLGVDYAQGFFIERPKSLANLWAVTE